jgi:hypothetical protein
MTIRPVAVLSCWPGPPVGDGQLGGGYLRTRKEQVVPGALASRWSAVHSSQPRASASAPRRKNICCRETPAVRAASEAPTRCTCGNRTPEQVTLTRASRRRIRGPPDPDAKRTVTSQPVSDPAVSCRQQFGPPPCFTARSGSLAQRGYGDNSEKARKLRLEIQRTVHRAAPHVSDLVE